jgi:MFS family permease
LDRDHTPEQPQRAKASPVARIEVPYPAPAVGWYATFILAFLYWLSVLDRFIISLLVDPIKTDMGISDVEFGMLHGLAFSITFPIFGLFAGVLADRFSRRWVIYLSVTIWSVGTAACGLVQHFWQLLLARVGVGAGEAGLNPSATSMLTDLFPRERLTSAMAVYAIGSTVGSGTAFLVGGYIVDLVSEMGSLSAPLLGDLRPWQSVFLIVGLPGALLALLIFTLPEPLRRNRRKLLQQNGFWKSGAKSYVELIKFMRVRWKFFLPHYLGFGIASMMISGGGVWYPAHMSRTYGWTASEIGLHLGITLTVVGIVGKLVCGYCVDAINRRGHQDAQLLWYGSCLLVATPVAILAMSSGNPWIFVGGVGVFMFLLAPMVACCFAALNLVTPNELRGAGVAFYTATAGIAAISAGPILVALVGDTFFAGPSSLGMGLAAVFGVACPIASMLLFSGRRAMREAVLGDG